MDRTRRHPLRGVTMTVWMNKVRLAVAATTLVVARGGAPIVWAGPQVAVVPSQVAPQPSTAAGPQVAVVPPGAAVPAATVTATVPAVAPSIAPTASTTSATVGEEVIIIQRNDAAASNRRRALGESPFVSIIDAAAHRGEQLSIASALIAAPSTQVRSLGGLGTFSSVSVRGAAPGHTAVMVNGVPLSRIASVTADLGAYSLESFSSVELFRGALPLELTGGGVGGAVNMVTRLGRSTDGERLRFALGGGSFGARNFNVWHGDRFAHDELASSTSIAYSAARGDFTVFSDNGTPLFPDDDGLMQRSHNGYWSVDASSRMGAVDQNWSAGARALLKSQQLPGSLYYPAAAAELATRNLILDATKRNEWVGDEGPVLVATHRVYATAEQQQFADPDNEIGLAAQERTYVTLAGGAQTQWTGAVGDHQITGLGQTQLEHFADEQANVDGMDARASTRGNRVGVALGVGAALRLGSRLTAEPAMRLDWQRTAPPVDGHDGMSTALPVRQQWLPSPRAGLRLQVTNDLAVKGSAGWYARVPTVTELFGDRGFFVGSPGLLPERGPATEIGAVWAPAHALGAMDRVLLEGSVFANRSRDTIIYVTQGGFVTRPLNVGNTMAGGGELAMSARFWRVLSATANYSLMYSTQNNSEPSYNGKELPRRPRHRGYVRFDAVGALARRQIAGFVDGSWQSHSYLDQGNLEQAPARWLLGIGARMDVGGGFAVSAEVKNLTDNRTERPSDGMAAPTAIVDVAGFPLPGRAFYARLEWAWR